MGWFGLSHLARLAAKIMLPVHASSLCVVLAKPVASRRRGRQISCEGFLETVILVGARVSLNPSVAELNQNRTRGEPSALSHPPETDPLQD